MGRKYQSLKEDLARNTVRDLMVVNDRLIRQKYFQAAHDMIQKMESLERKIQNFHASDQKLFSEWYKLTFRGDQDVIDRTQLRLKELTLFHNWVVATARQLDIDLPGAYLLMKEEERRYENGTPEEKRKIELEREKRNAFIESDSRAKYDEDSDFAESKDQDDDDNDHPLDQIFERLEELFLPLDREVLASPKERMDRLSSLSDEQLQFGMKDQECLFLLFHLGMSWAERHSDPSFFLRLWKLFSKEQKKFFSEVYSSVTGESLRNLVKAWDRLADSKVEDDGDEPEVDEEDFQFNEDFIHTKKSNSERSHRFTPGEEENFKQIYRKLIRQLHPDANQKSMPSWMKRFWESVQKAYKAKDLLSLDRLLKLTLLRTDSLDQLTVDEIQEASHWLEKDLEILVKEERQLKKSMAWGFSQKKEYTALTRKIKKDFDETLNTILFQIREIKDQHRFLENLASKDPFDEQKIRRQRKTERNQNRRRKRRPSRIYDDPQESFY
ncbi:MAG: hypothetical protein ACAH59_10750 [Pseudobdellovibrionaceae bacterium]